ncbi:AAA family ATPase [Streptomyces sp. S.PNR 29]|uniref:nSTAND1 domain-containing NTPase n=1 Tax=Streptomyces sp. S.PNR 29 TaxID=2973805 RepID=UPI0025AF32BF|nr:AAA family ATPase [Streptomyces sp. S.PNR 29]
MAVPRGERPLETRDDPLVRFAADLRRLRQKAGNPPYRTLAERAHYSISTLSSAASGQRLPTLAVTLAYVQACDGDVEEWERTWRAVAAEVGGVTDPDPTEAGSRSPYVGLAAFQAQDAEWFFGREQLVAELAQRLGRQRFVVVVGASGSGKSSLLRAGLVPRLAVAATVVVFTPGARPLEECAVRLGALAGVTPGALQAELSTDAENLGRVVRQIAARAENGGGEVVLVVDQFEETFTLCKDEAERHRFITALLTAAAADGSRCRVVLGVRADFYAHCTRHPELAEAMRDAQVPVGPMTLEQLRRAVAGPAQRAGLTVQGALLATLTAQAHGQAGVLPLLSHALLETWRRRRGNALTLEAFQATGGLEGSLARTAEAFYQGLEGRQRELARQVFLRLTALGDGTEDTRRPAQLEELEGLAGADGDGLGAVLDGAARARLLTLDRDRVELAHEALIRCWPRLHEWLTEDREALRTQRQLTDSAQEWERLGRDEGALYRGARLASAAGLSQSSLSTGEREFLRASLAARRAEEAAARRQMRRQRRLLLTLIVLLAVTVTAGAVAYDQRSDALVQRRVALSRAMAAQSAAIAEGQPEASMMLAVQAFGTARTTEARSALLSTQSEYFDGRLTGHSGPVNAIVFRPGGRQVATASSDRTVRIWDVGRRREVATLRGHAGIVLAIAFSPDGRLLAAGTADRKVRVWDVDRRRSVAVFPGRARGLAFSPDGRSLAYGGSDGRVTLRQVATGRITAVLRGHGDSVNSLAFDRRGTRLASGSDDHTVRLWSLARHRTLAVLRGHGDAVNSVVFSPDNKTLAVGYTDHTVRLWDALGHRSLARLRGHTDQVNSVAFSHDGSMLASAGGEGVVRLWDVADRRLIAVLPGHTDYVMDVAFSATANVLASAGFDGTVALWDLDRSVLISHPLREVGALALSPDGRTLAVAGDNRKVELWDLPGRRRAATLAGHTGAVRSVAFSPDGHVLATAGNDGTTRLWDLGGRRTTATLAGHTGAVQSVAFSPDGRTLATAGTDRTVRLWEVAGGTSTAVLAAHSDFVNTVAFSPDGRVVATASDDRTVRLWKVTGRRPTATLTGHTGAVRSVAFSPDGHTLATAGNDGTTRLWDLTDRRSTATLTGHTGAVRSVAFSPDGRTLATASNDGTTRLWDRADGRIAATLTGHTAAVSAVAYSATDTLLTGSTDGTVRIWDMDVRRRIANICRAIGPPGPGKEPSLEPGHRDGLACP